MSSNNDEERAASRHYVSRGVDVRVTEEADEIRLQLDDMPINVTYLHGEYHSQLANQFTGFPTIDALVDSLLETEGQTWTLHGRLRGGGHSHGGENPVSGTGHEHRHHAPEGGER
ncbi:hypothetical protein AB0O22_17430 [Streptomyces sp. NPDC091204]|uniref:hypothetical protein n=1 Tax=Streptomyces sp. NPDC091204 TaxID=3155299 RepID=UPI003432FCDE